MDSEAFGGPYFDKVLPATALTAPCGLYDLKPLLPPPSQHMNMHINAGT